MCTGLYLLLSPLFPFIVPQSLGGDETKGYIYKSRLVTEESKKLQITFEKLKEAPKENTLVIPKIGVDTTIMEGESEKTLDKGIWHRPQTSTPDKGGNTVLAGHRYMYTSGPHTLFYLDKVQVGNKIIVYWNRNEYDYEVTEVKEVPPTATEIEDNTDESMLTIYTCTPVYTTLRRLVVTAKLINNEVTSK